MSTEGAEVLLEAGKLISDLDRWCTRALAMSARGFAVDPMSRTAVRWDPAGAVLKVLRLSCEKLPDSSRTNIAASALAELQLAAQSLHKRSIERVNDDIGHAAALDCFRLAIRRARAVQAIA